MPRYNSVVRLQFSISSTSVCGIYNCKDEVYHLTLWAVSLHITQYCVRTICRFFYVTPLVRMTVPTERPVTRPFKFDVHGSVHRKYIPIYIQQDATLHSLFISGNCSTCFGCYFHSSSGAHTTVSTASGICHTVTATCRYRGGVGTPL